MKPLALPVKFAEPNYSVMLGMADLWCVMTDAPTGAEAARQTAVFLKRMCGSATATVFLSPNWATAFSVPESFIFPTGLRDRLGTAQVHELPYWLSDAGCEPVAVEAEGSFVPHAVAVMPLVAAEGMLGRAVLFWKAGEPALPPLEWLATVAHIGALGLGHAMSRLDFVWRERHLAVRNAVLAIVSQANSLEVALQGALDAICEGIGCDVGAIYLLQASGETYHLACHRGVSLELAERLATLPRRGSLLAATMEGEGFLEIHHLNTQPEAPDRSRTAGIVEWMGAPLRSPDGNLGGICLASRREGDLAPSDWELLRAVGLNLGVAVDHLRTHLQMKQAFGEINARWSTLYKIGSTLTIHTDSERLLDEIVHGSVDLLGGVGGVLALMDEPSGDLVVAVSYQREGTPWNMLGRRLAAGEGINGMVLASRKPMIVTNYAEWSGRLPDLATHALAIIAVPLLTQDRILGVLTISDQAGSRQFTEDDVQTLVLFAQQAAAVLAEQLSRRQAEALVLYEERARLARDLHDGLAQDLASLLMRAELCQALAGDAEDDLRANLEIISVGLQRAIREARSTILALRASTPTACDLEADVRNLAAAFAAQTHMPVQVEAIGADCGRLAELQRLALLDAVREALWNVQKHARASLVQLRLTWDGDACVRVLVNDDGVGFDPRALAAPGVADTLHFGLTMRQERLAAFGGTLRVHSAPGKGTVVEASLPIVHDG